ncbi:MAG: hypothetical protein LBE08_08385 [Bifidobacteriaceae bacterium]|jgi:hypothetical protein|nr:hypothetical protein [Bifidobacteriaceae bacterium]
MNHRRASRRVRLAAACGLGLALLNGCAGGGTAPGTASGTALAGATLAATAKQPPPPAAEASGPACTLPDPNAGTVATSLEAGGGWLTLPTYDGSNQSTHINVQFDPEGRFGHPFWMTLTPYPYQDASKENPSILVSDNGLDWAEPAGLTNPVSGVPDDVNRKGHYSDGYLLPRPDGFELWFRYNPARAGETRADNSTNIIYRMNSPDGVTWSEKEVIFDGGIPNYMSPSLIAEGEKYRLWYSNYGGELVYSEATGPDFLSWSDPQAVTVEMGQGYVPWHQEIRPTDSGYEALLVGYRTDPASQKSSFALFYAQSTDGLNFGQAHQIDPAKVDLRLAGHQLYKSSLVQHCGSYLLYLSTITPEGAWLPFYKQVGVDELSQLFMSE